MNNGKVKKAMAKHKQISDDFEKVLDGESLDQLMNRLERLDKQIAEEKAAEAKEDPKKSGGMHWPTGQRLDDHDIREVKEVFGRATATYVAMQFNTGVIDADRMKEDAGFYAQNIFDQMAPRDPIELFLVAEAFVTHWRCLKMNYRAATCTSADESERWAGCADRASNTLRRLALALSEYKNPRKTIIARRIGQLNTAEQQLVNNAKNGNSQNGNSTNELSTKKTLPALPAGTEGTEPDVQGEGATRATVASFNRAAHRRRKGQVGPELVPARRAKPGTRTRKPGVPGAAQDDEGDVA